MRMYSPRQPNGHCCSMDNMMRHTHTRYNNDSNYDSNDSVSTDYRNGVTRTHLAGGQDSSRSCPCALTSRCCREQGGLSTIRLDNSSVGLTRVTNGDCESGVECTLWPATRRREARASERSTPRSLFSTLETYSSDSPFLPASLSVSRRNSSTERRLLGPCSPGFWSMQSLRYQGCFVRETNNERQMMDPSLVFEKRSARTAT